MGETTNISWGDCTYTPWIGCTEVSVGDKGACVGCYARELAARYGFAEWGNHPRHRTSEANWRRPLAWNRKAAKDGTRPFVFCASLADVFDNQVPAEWRRDLLDLIRATPHLTWLLLTKRPQNIAKLFDQAYGNDRPTPGLLWDWPRNAAIGCTVVTQAEADRDIPVLLAAKAALNPAFAFVSMEPLMEAVDLTRMQVRIGYEYPYSCLHPRVGLDWVIAGGETDQGKHKARPSAARWFRDLRDQCAAAGVPFHFKQWGEWGPGSQGERGPFAFGDYSARQRLLAVHHPRRRP